MSNIQTYASFDGNYGGTRNDEDAIFNSYACIPKNILHNATSLHTSKHMLNDILELDIGPIEYFIGNGKRAIARFLFRYR